MGVWIETQIPIHEECSENNVTPCMGVWIETFPWQQYAKDAGSHPVWVCGLKRR